MRTVQIDAPGSIDSLVLRQTDQPTPASDEVLIEFGASSINPADVKIRTGLVRPRVGTYPFTLGYDLVGRIVGNGALARKYAPGTRVLAMSAVAITGRGMWADYACLPEQSIAALPDTIDAFAAARLPLVGLTAFQAVQSVDVKPGDEVLVAGAAGSIGQYVVQLLLQQHVKVHALVRRVEQAQDLPLHDNIEVHTRPQRPESVAVVIDAAGGDFSAALGRGGTYVSLVPESAPDRDVLAQRDIKRKTILTQESGQDLEKLVALVSSGLLTLPTPRVFALGEVHAAHKEYEEHGQRHVVLAS